MSDERKPKASDSMEFYMGILLLALGLFFLLTKAKVTSMGFYSFTIGGFSLSSGLVIIPLIIGIIWLVYNPKSILARIITILGGIFIIGAIITSVRITFPYTSLFDYVMMFILISAGVGLLLKAFFKKGK